MPELIPDGWVPLIEAALSPAAVIIVCVIFYTLARRGLNILQSRGALAPPVVALLRLLLRWTFILLLLFLLLNAFGVLENVWGAFLAAIAMVAVGFVAVWSVLSNAFCTLLLLIYRPFEVGDHIVIPGDNLEGTVSNLNLMFTTLSGSDGEIIQVPNNQFFQKAIRRLPGETKIDLYDQLRKTESNNEISH